MKSQQKPLVVIVNTINMAYSFGMSVLKKSKDTFFRVLFDAFPSLLDQWAKRTRFLEAVEIPWTPLKKPLSACRVALVTTTGVHMKSQPPFDMGDPEGDATFREFPIDTPKEALTITHDYYNHADADRDINVVLPVDRLKELASRRFIGEAASNCYSFMGHITGRHLNRLLEETAPAVAALLHRDSVDLVVLTPA